MILLSDNDLIVKMAQCDLIDDTLEMLELTYKECFILSSLKYSLRLDDPDLSIRKYFGSCQAYDRASQVVNSCSCISEMPQENIELLVHMQEITEIDPGEFILLQQAKHHYDKSLEYKLFTGDKRALSAICEYEHFEIFGFLKRNIICLESCLLDLIHYRSFEYINTKLITARSQIDDKKFDTVLRMAFGSGKSQEDSTTCLKEYYKHLNKLF